METDPLQQLRDIHLPADPSWWPPAPGWWVLLLVAVCALVWLCLRTWLYWRRRAPLREARRLLLALHADYQRGDLAGHTYLDRANEILKRLLVRAYGRTQYAPLAGDEWLDALDALSETTAFTAGASQALGNQRFAREVQADIDLLHNDLMSLLSKVPA